MTQRPKTLGLQGHQRPAWDRGSELVENFVIVCKVEAVLINNYHRKVRY